VDAREAMRSIGSCRRYKPDDVPDEVVYRAVEAARFAPQGGNRQPTRLVAVRDRALKEKLRDLYLVPWRKYYEAASAGTASTGSLGEYDSAQRAADAANRFAENLAEVPLLIVVCARIDALHVTDKDLDRPSVVGGASIYPFVQNLCIALRVEGVATTITTLLCEYEAEVKDLLKIPDEYLTACHLAAGYPKRGFPKKLRRMPVEETTFIDRFGDSLGTP
jgi:nitroreductase